MTMRPRILDESQVDMNEVAVDEVLDSDELRLAEEMSSGTTEFAPNLTDGGRVRVAELFPMQDGQRVSHGRAVARQAWSWNGTESLLPLAWNPAGKAPDGARRYLRKKHCLCCGNSGFQKPACPLCIKNRCQKCGGRVDKKLVIRNFYLSKEEVPFPQRFYGSVNCFLPGCSRSNGSGFHTEEEMRMHAMTRHRMEYRAHMETVQAGKADEVDRLRDQLNALTAQLIAKPQEPVVEKTPVVEAVSMVPSPVTETGRPVNKGGRPRKRT